MIGQATRLVGICLLGLCGTACKGDAAPAPRVDPQTQSSGQTTTATQAGTPSIAPLSPAARSALAEAATHEEAGDLEAAAAAARAAVEAGAKNEGELELAKIAILSKRYGLARQRLEALVEQAPQLASAHYNLAYVEQHDEHYNAARSGYLRALELDPGLKAARYNLAILTFDNGIVDEARHHAKAYAELDPGSDTSKILLARVGLANKAPPSP